MKATNHATTHLRPIMPLLRDHLQFLEQCRPALLDLTLTWFEQVNRASNSEQCLVTMRTPCRVSETAQFGLRKLAPMADGEKEHSFPPNAGRSFPESASMSSIGTALLDGAHSPATRMLRSETRPPNPHRRTLPQRAAHTDRAAKNGKRDEFEQCQVG